MKIVSVVILFMFLGCTTNPSITNNRNNMTDNSIKEVKYYKCNYTVRDSLIVVLGSGTDSKSYDEYWAISPKNIKSFNEVDLKKVDIEMLVKIGKKHLSERFHPIDLKFVDVSIQTIDENQAATNNLIAIISFEYEENTFQMIPILLDGTIVLSSNE